jgi:O-antigen chain-terminating methyltransferase
MSSTQDPTDLSAILADLQAEIERHRIALGELGAIDQPDPLEKVRQRQRVNSHLPIGWPVMPKGVVPKLTAYAQKITRRLLRWYINPLVDQQNEYNAAVSEVLATMLQQMEEFDLQLHSMRDVVDYVRERYEQQQAEVELRLQRLENRQRNLPDAGGTLTRSSEAQEQQEPSAGGIDYFVLGAKYRNEVQMSSRAGDYDDMFKPLAESERPGTDQQAPVLDIGCGRGDFVDHLRELGVNAYGIDIDKDAIALGQAANRNVLYADAFAHLMELPANSLAAVTLIQVIEHFAVDDLYRLFGLVAEKLRPGGFVVAETINPQCLWSLSNWYLLDPSHKTPVHPQMAQFLLEQVGLSRIQIRMLRPVPEKDRLALLPSLANEDTAPWSPKLLNRNFDRLNEFLFGPQDYAVIAFKPTE